MTRIVPFALTALLAGCGASHPTVSSPQGCTPPACAIEPQLLAIEVSPPPEQVLVLSDLDLSSVTVDTDGYLQVQLPSPVVISGKILVGQGGRATILNGTVVAKRPSHIAGRPDKFYQALIDNVTGEYSLRVSE